MLKQFIAAVVLFYSGAAQAGTCDVAESQLPGAWQDASGDGHFEVFSLQKQAKGNLFHSWLHQRPEIVSAGWTYRDCILTITPEPAGMEPMRFRVLSASSATLHLRDTSDGSDAVYRRLD